MAHILFIGDSPTVNSGFSACTRHACAHLHTLGHTITVAGLHYDGIPHAYPYDIWPGANAYDVFCVRRVPELIATLEPDLVIILNDPWNVRGYLDAIDDYFNQDGAPPRPKFKTLGWLAVDAENQQLGRLGDLDHIAVWTQFAHEQMSRVGVSKANLSIVPLGVDLNTFTPAPAPVGDDQPPTDIEAQLVARKAVYPPWAHNKFVIGYVGRNQGRKRLELLINYTGRWARENDLLDDIALHLHCAPTGEHSIAIPEVVRHAGLASRVILSEVSPRVGIPEQHMPLIYRAMDVFATCSQAEGWCLPALEAMACGIPCLLPAHSGFDWAWSRDESAWLDFGEAMTCNQLIASAPNSGMWTMGRLPSYESFAEQLSIMYESLSPDKKSQFGYVPGYRPRAIAEDYSWKSACVKLAKVVEGMVP